MFVSAVRLTAFTLAAATLAACATAAPVATISGATQRVSTKTPARTPHVTYISAESVVEIPADLATVNLEFNLKDGADMGRQLLQAAAANSVLDQVHHVVFTLTGPGLPEPLVATVLRADFINGKAVVQFNNLPPGALTISAIAYDANGNQLVEAAGNGNVNVGELTQVRLNCLVPPGAELGHVRIEMDCFGDCAPAPVATPSSFVPYPIADVNFHSVGDPHEDGANDLKFENQISGYYMALRTLTDDFILTKHQSADPNGRWPGMTLNNAVAIKSNGELFTYYMYGRRMRLNGAPLEVKAKAVYTSPKGLKITCTSVGGGKAVVDLATTQGDKVRIEDQAMYINIVGSLGSERVIHEVRGGLGSFNNGTNQQGLLMRDGTVAPSLDAFLAEWQARDDEKLFDEPIEANGNNADANNNLIEVN